jgi:thymidylate kinase
VPRPDLWILLDAPTEVLRARKQEVSTAELDRLRGAYNELIRGLPHSHVVDAAKPLDAVCQEVEGLILARAG